MTSYIGLIRKDAGSDFGVDFPDFPGCVTAAATLDEARALAEEALGFHVEGMIEDREALPVPSTLDHVMADPHNRDAVAILVPVKGVPKPVRVNVVLDADLLDRIAAISGNRSRFLADAAREKLAREVA